MTKIEGILFDLDQTLMDRDKSLHLFLDKQWNKQKSLQAISKNDFITKFIELDKNGIVWKDEVYSQILNDFGIKDIHYNDLLTDYLANFSQNAVLFPDVMDVLQTCENQKIKLGIITNGREDLQSSVIRACNLDQIMDVILISEVEGIKKPDPIIFKSALNHLSLSPASCIFIGDNPDTDIKGAYNVGMKAIWKENKLFQEPDKSITSSTFTDFKDLLSILDNLIKS
ncbi:MAG: HAD family hydrolase [Gammaproteobacteria bacterium]